MTLILKKDNDGDVNVFDTEREEFRTFASGNYAEEEAIEDLRYAEKDLAEFQELVEVRKKFLERYTSGFDIDLEEAFRVLDDRGYSYAPRLEPKPQADPIGQIQWDSVADIPKGVAFTQKKWADSGDYNSHYVSNGDGTVRWHDGLNSYHTASDAPYVPVPRSRLLAGIYIEDVLVPA